MLKVKVRRSAILIYPYTMGMLDNLEKALSVWDNIIHKYTTHLYGCENNEHRYTLAKCNFILNNFNTNNLKYNSCFNE